MSNEVTSPVTRRLRLNSQEQIDHYLRLRNLLKKNVVAFDASMMGLGKTYVTCYLAMTMGTPLIIVAPLITIDKWRQLTTTYQVPTFEIVTYDTFRTSSGSLLTKRTKRLRGRDESKESYDEYLLGYESAGTYQPTTRLLKLIREVGCLVVFDESQKIKNTSSQNEVSCALSAVVRQYNNPKCSSNVLFLSGTLLDKEDAVINYGKVIGLCEGNQYFTQSDKGKGIELSGNALDFLFNLFEENPLEATRSLYRSLYDHNLNRPTAKVNVLLQHRRNRINEDAQAKIVFENRFMSLLERKVTPLMKANHASLTTAFRRMLHNNRMPEYRYMQEYSHENLLQIASDYDAQQVDAMRVFDFFDGNNIPSTLYRITNAYEGSLQLHENTYRDNIRHEMSKMNLKKSHIRTLFFDAYYKSHYSESDVPDIEIDAKIAYYPLEDKQEQATYDKLIESIQRTYQGEKKENRTGDNKYYKDFMDIHTIKTKLLCRIIKFRLRKYPTHKFVIGCNYVDNVVTFKEYLAEFNPIVIYGGTDKHDRPEGIRRFQENNDDFRLIIGNINIMCMGIDLDDKFGDRPRELWCLPTYSIIDQQQLVYRVQRVGTASVPIIRFLYIEPSEDHKRRGIIPESRIIARIQEGCTLLAVFHPKQAAVQKFPGHYDKERWIKLADGRYESRIEESDYSDKQKYIEDMNPEYLALLDASHNDRMKQQESYKRLGEEMSPDYSEVGMSLKGVVNEASMQGSLQFTPETSVSDALRMMRVTKKIAPTSI